MGTDLPDKLVQFSENIFLLHFYGLIAGYRISGSGDRCRRPVSER